MNYGLAGNDFKSNEAVFYMENMKVNRMGTKMKATPRRRITVISK